MSYHKLLQRQINKYLNKSNLTPEIENFFSAVNDSYNAFERDKDLWTHAFSLSENEYQEVNDNLAKEFNIKQLSIVKIKEALREFEGDEDIIDTDENDDLLSILNYLNKQIIKRKEVEENLAKTAQILTTLVNNLNSGIMMEDENRHILYINQEFCRLFNIPAPPQALIGTDCSNAAEQSKSLFEEPEVFIKRIDTILKDRKKVLSEEIKLADGKYYERDYIPIFLSNVYKGHQWRYKDISDRKNNEFKLIQNQAELKRLSLVASANENGVLLTDINGHIFWSNEGFKNLTGFELNDLLGKTPIEIGSGPMCDPVQIESMIQAYRQRQNFLIEIAFYRKDHTWFWGRVKGQPILDETNNLQHYFSIIEDISFQKDQEQLIQRLSLVASANSNGVFILDNNLEFEWINPAYEAITGYSFDELKHKNPIKLFTDENTDRKVLERMYEKDQRGEDFTEEFLHWRKGAPPFWSRLTMQFVKNSEGNVMQRFGIMTDITKEREARHAAFLQEEKYRNIIANMNLGLLEVDNDDHIQYANKSFLDISGYNYNEIIGKRAVDLFINKDFVETVAKKTRKRQKGESDAYELQVFNKKGESRYWLISGAPRFDDKGNVVGSIGIHLDITKQKIQENELIEARKKAEESSEAKEAFLANMSHEIRTPLNAIIGMLRELSKESVTGKQRAYLNSADTASRHLLSIINNILDMSKIESGEFQLENRHFSLNSAIDETVSIVSSDAQEKLIKLEVNIDPDLKPAQQGDPARIRQILINILGNSIKFTENGKISIDCKVLKTTHSLQVVIITITDTGIGMEKSYLKNLFKKFSQENSSTARKYGGTGLGMAITNELVHLMGGNINIDSEKGKGTTVVLEIPLKIGNINKIHEATLTENFNELKDVKILLAEDNEMNRLVAKNSLSYFGMEVTEAENGEIAIKKLRENHYDVVLMDLHMPEMNGLEATRRIRNELKSHIPVIALTANAFKKEIDQSLAAGMNDYVTKPFEENVLLQTILKHLPHKKAKSKPDNKVAKPVRKHEPLYNLTNLENISRGDQGFIQKNDPDIY